MDRSGNKAFDAIVLLFVKAPRLGRVKSRLAADIGENAALELYKNFILDTVDLLNRSGYPFRICLFPPEERTTIDELLGPGYQIIGQQGDDLGQRMKNAFTRSFSEGFTRVVLIGSDIPDFKPEVIDEAVQSLTTNEVVLGPASDGGYYLIGFNSRAFLPDVFRNIAWSTQTVFRDTMDILATASRRTHLVPMWTDVDSLDDLKALFLRNKKSEFRGSKTMIYLAGSAWMETN